MSARVPAPQGIGKAPGAIIAAIVASVARIAKSSGPNRRGKTAFEPSETCEADPVPARRRGPRRSLGCRRHAAVGQRVRRDGVDRRGSQEEAREPAHRARERQERRPRRCETDVDAIAAEREKLNKRLVETADLIKKSEGQLTSIEGRLGELGAQEKMLKGSLNERQGQIAKLLSALQRMGRNPPPVLITQREDALKMVRSAMLLAAAFPQLGNQARALAARLTELLRVMTEMRAQSEQLRTETTRLNDAKTRLAGLLDAKKTSLDERQGELKRMRMVSAEISESVTDLNELISKLDQAVKENTGLGAYEKENKDKTAAAPPSAAPETKPQPGAAPATAPTTAADAKPQPPAAAPSTAGKSTDVVELSPGTALGSPGRIKPEIAFRRRQGPPHYARARPAGTGLRRKDAVRRTIEGTCARNPAGRPSHVTL